MSTSSEGRLPDASRWHGRRVLVTGHTGFKGTWLTRWLVQLGAEVHGLALDPPTSPSVFEMTGTAALLASDHRVDVRDAADVTATMAALQPSVVLHLAAQPLVRDAFRDPATTFDINAQGTVHVLDAIARCGSADAAVIITTDKVYAPSHRSASAADRAASTAPHREDDPLGADDPYSWSKVMAEHAVTAFRALPGIDGRQGWTVPIATARAGNVVGGGDWASERLVPDSVRAFLAGRSVQLRHPGAVRPWQHVLEPLAGYLVLAEALLEDGPRHAHAFNFGPGDGGDATVGEVAQRLADAWGAGARVDEELDRSAPPENPALRLDSSLAMQELGWRPRWDLTQTLAQTCAWYQQVSGGTDAGALTDLHLRAYTGDHDSAGPPAGERA